MYSKTYQTYKHCRYHILIASDTLHINSIDVILYIRSGLVGLNIKQVASCLNKYKKIKPPVIVSKT